MNLIELEGGHLPADCKYSALLSLIQRETEVARLHLYWQVVALLEREPRIPFWHLLVEW